MILIIARKVEKMFVRPKVLVDVFGLNLIAKAVCVREKQTSFRSIPFFDVVIVKVVHEALTQIQNTHTNIDWLVHQQPFLDSPYRHKVLVEYLARYKSRLRRNLYHLFFTGDQPYVYPLTYVLHGLAKHCIVHKLEKFITKLVSPTISFLSPLGVEVDVWFQPLRLVER